MPSTALTVFKKGSQSPPPNSPNQPQSNPSGPKKTKKIWDWLAVAKVAFTIFFVAIAILVWKFFDTGVAPTAPGLVGATTAPETVEVITGNTFSTFLIMSCVVCVAYYLLSGWWAAEGLRKQDKNKRKWPTKPFLMFLFVLPIVHGLAWLAMPVYWTEWYRSGFAFWIIQLALVAVPLLVGKKSPLHDLAVVLIVLIVITSMWAKRDDFKSTGKRFWDEAKESFGVVSSQNSLPVNVTKSSWNWENATCVEDTAVRNAFPGDTTMWKIARAESNCMQFKSNGTVVRNPSSSAVGIFQILEDTHGKNCGIKGVDIHTLEGNIACARNLSLRNPNYSDWDESAGRWRDGYRIDTVVIPTAPPVIVTMIERIAIDTILIKLEGDSSWSEVIDTKTLPTTYSRGGNSTYSQQDCIDEEICEGQIYSGLSNTKRDLGNARFVRLRSDSASMWMRIEVGRKFK